METMRMFLDTLLHLDKTLNTVIQNYGVWTYLILFVILFAETGLVVTPFLPGDSLLFATGIFAATGALHPGLLFLLLTSAALVGDNTNYWLGRTLGPKVFREEGARFFKRQHLERTHRFYEKYGGKTIIMARFVPIVRTFAPFVAGLGTMRYSLFLSYSVFGAILWVGVCVSAGYFFGGLEIVRKNFSLAVLAIIVISLLPMAIEFWKHRATAAKGSPDSSLSPASERTRADG